MFFCVNDRRGRAEVAWNSTTVPFAHKSLTKASHLVKSKIKSKEIILCPSWCCGKGMTIGRSKELEATMTSTTLHTSLNLSGNLHLTVPYNTNCNMLRSKFKCLHLWSTDSPQECQDHWMGKEQSFQQKVLGSLDIPMSNNEVGPLPHTKYKN